MSWRNYATGLSKVVGNVTDAVNEVAHNVASTAGRRITGKEGQGRGFEASCTAQTIA